MAKQVANKIRDFDNRDFGEAALYALTPPTSFNGEQCPYVVVSSCTVPVGRQRGKQETMVFAADPSGEVLDYDAPLANVRGLDHGVALKDMGYELQVASALSAPTLADKFPQVFTNLSLVYEGTTVEKITEAFAQQPATADNLILLAELSNYSAKIARETFKERRDAENAEHNAKDDRQKKDNAAAHAKNLASAKVFDVMGGSLMKAAKGEILAEAVSAGARAIKALDAGNLPVALLCADKHQIALHEVAKEQLETMPQDNSVEFTGFRRQWLAPLTIASVLGDGRFAAAIGAASKDISAASVMQDALEGQGYQPEAVGKLGKEPLLRIVEEAAPAGKLDNAHKLVAAAINATATRGAGVRATVVPPRVTP